MGFRKMRCWLLVVLVVDGGYCVTGIKTVGSRVPQIKLSLLVYELFNLGQSA